MEEQEYYKASQVAEILGKGWSRQRVHIELKRGTLFVEPAVMVGNQPLWTKEQVEQLKKIKKSKN